MRTIKTETTRLNDSIDAKDNIIDELQVWVSKLEVIVYDTEQYSRMANVRVQDIYDMGAGEEARDKVLQVIN